MPDEPLWLDAQHAADRIGLPVTTFEGLAKANIIPAGVQVTERVKRWRSDTVDATKQLLEWLLTRRPRRVKPGREENLRRETGNSGRQPRKKRRRDDESNEAPEGA